MLKICKNQLVNELIGKDRGIVDLEQFPFILYGHSIYLPTLNIHNYYLTIHEKKQFTFWAKSLRVEYHLRKVWLILWYRCYRLNYVFYLIQVLNWSNICCSLDVHRYEHGICLSYISTNDFVIMIIYHCRRILIPRFFQIPNFDRLIHGRTYKLSIMKQYRRYIVIMCIKFIYTCTCLKTKYVYFIILPCQSKWLLPWKLTCYRYSWLANEKWLFASECVFLEVYLIHFYEAIFWCCYEFEGATTGGLINEDYVSYFFFWYELKEGFAIVYSFQGIEGFFELLWKLARALDLSFLKLFFFDILILILIVLLSNLHCGFMTLFWMQIFKKLSRRLTKFSHMCFICFSLVRICDFL